MKYVFPCIINKTQNLYSLSFPDLENRKIFGTDLYDILRMAHNVLLIDLYVKEAQRMVIADPTPFEKLNIENGQIVSYITCDTDMLSNMLDLYDNIQTNDLEKFLQEKSEEEAEKGEESDYDFGSTEYPTTDKYVKVISHHKATSNPEVYEEYRKIVESDAHELAKLIKRQFKTKPGRVKRADHGDLNLMRYKDPNFRSPLIFDKKKPREKHCAAVMLLVDESGSMGGRRITNARLAAIMLAEAMAEAGIPCSVVGHSGDDRYNYSVELEHYTTFKNASADRASLAMIEARCQNRDGPAIRWASSILKKRPERNKLMIVISDGQPAADRYYGEEAIFDTKAAIRDAKRLHNIVGVILEAGSSTDILKTMYGNDYVECTSSKNLKESIAKIITSQCKNW